MNRFSRTSQQDSDPYRGRDQERAYGEPGQPDYSLGQPNPYASSRADEDDGWRENLSQREIDDYRHRDRSSRRAFEQNDYPYDARQYSRPESGWRDAPEGWDRYARQQRGSAYEYYSGRSQGNGPHQHRAQGEREQWQQSRQNLQDFPDFNPQDSHYVYPGASRSWDRNQRQYGEARESYHGYPYSPRDFERSWQHHPSHDQNEYAQSYSRRYQGDESGGRHEHSGNRARGAYGLSADHLQSSHQPYRSSEDYYSQNGYAGRGPKGYERSDERLREEICERLERDPYIDASEILISVKNGVVTLEGSVDDRMQKHRAEDTADACSGVKDVQNRINVSRRDQWDLSKPDHQEAQLASEPQNRQRDNGENKPTSQQTLTRQ
jgi:osmotically-inducible protein OsmY